MIFLYACFSTGLDLFFFFVFFSPEYYFLMDLFSKIPSTYNYYSNTGELLKKNKIDKGDQYLHSNRSQDLTSGNCSNRTY